MKPSQPATKPDDETNTNLLHCSRRHHHYISQHDALVTFLQQLQTPIDIIQPIAGNILFWQTNNGNDPPTSPNTSDRARRCIEAQQQLGWHLATCGVMTALWGNTIPDPKHLGLGSKWQAKVSRWLLQAAHHTWTDRNHERYRRDDIDAQNAQDRETEANVRKVFHLAHTFLSTYDQTELMHRTLEAQLAIPEASNRIWAQQQQRIIYRRIRLNRTRPNLTDIRQYFTPAQSTHRHPHHPNPQS